VFLSCIIFTAMALLLNHICSIEDTHIDRCFVIDGAVARVRKQSRLSEYCAFTGKLLHRVEIPPACSIIAHYVTLRMLVVQSQTDIHVAHVDGTVTPLTADITAHRAAFAADGSWVAVNDDIYNTGTGEKIKTVLWRPDINLWRKRRLMSTTDSSVLLGAGWHTTDGMIIIHAWATTGQGGNAIRIVRCSHSVMKDLWTCGQYIHITCRFGRGGMTYTYDLLGSDCFGALDGTIVFCDPANGRVAIWNDGIATMFDESLTTVVAAIKQGAPREKWPSEIRPTILNHHLLIPVNCELLAVDMHTQALVGEWPCSAAASVAVTLWDRPTVLQVRQTHPFLPSVPGASAMVLVLAANRPRQPRQPRLGPEVWRKLTGL